MLFTKPIWLTLVVCVFLHSTALAQGDFYSARVKVFPSYLREQFPERQLFSLMCVATIFPLETAKFKTVPSLTSASSASGLGILTAKLLPHF
jgi:hypothetical protein